MKKLLPVIVLLTIFCSSIQSQDLGTTLKQVGSEYAKRYLEPFTTGLGTNLNSSYIGGFTPSGYSKLPVTPHFWVGMKFCGVIMQEQDKRFSDAFNTEVQYMGQTFPAVVSVQDAPTVFGYPEPAIGNVRINLGNGLYKDTTMALIGGVDNSRFVPLLVPQIGVGTVFGTDMVVRYLPGFDVGNYGSLNLFGVALRHNISAYIKQLPLDIAVQLGFQTMSLKDKYKNKFVSANSMFANLQFSKTVTIITFYGGVQYENYDVDVNYNFSGTEISFNQKGENSFRGILGVTISAGPIKFNVDGNLGNKFAFSTGLGLGL